MGTELYICTVGFSCIYVRVQLKGRVGTSKTTIIVGYIEETKVQYLTTPTPGIRAYTYVLVQMCVYMFPERHQLWCQKQVNRKSVYTVTVRAVCCWKVTVTYTKARLSRDMPRTAKQWRSAVMAMCRNGDKPHVATSNRRDCSRSEI